MGFKLPEVMPTGTEELSTLRGEAQAAFDELSALHTGGASLSGEQVQELRDAVSAMKAADAAVSAAAALAAEVSGLFAEGAEAVVEETEEVTTVEETEESTEGEEAAAAEAGEAAAAVVAAAGKSVARTSFAGVQRGKAKAHIPRGTGSLENVGFRMSENMPGAVAGKLVDFAEIAQAYDRIGKGHRPRTSRATAGGNQRMGLFSIERAGAPVVETSHELVAAIEAATDLSKLVRPTFGQDGSLTAAGGWCAPSEQLYDFCQVPLATDLLSLPEITIRRGGVRWPIEPDLTSIFESFEFFFTEPELEALPAPIKECVEIPCPDEFKEIRLSAVGYCVEAGILQAQGWPELIEWFMRAITQEHFRAISRRSILDMVKDSTPVNLNASALGVSASSSILNSIDLMAVNLRLQKGYARGYPIEAVAPNWLHNVIRADFAMQWGLDIKSVTDAQIDAWFAQRNVSFQFVADWQTREVGMPGNLGTTQWPGAVSLLMYPAGTWFRQLAPVIEFGVQYPRELLQINRYSQMFTEDSYAIARRCDASLVVTVPTCVNGGYGGPITVTCNSPANEVQSLAVTGSPTGGSITLTFQGQTTAAIDHAATASAVQTALEALSNVNPGDIVATGGALGTNPVVLTFGGQYAGTNVAPITVTTALTGGTNPTAAITVTTQGAS